MSQKQIDKIIVKLIDNTISENESEVLKKWLQDEDNLMYFNQFIEVNHLANSLSEFSYESSLDKILNTPKKKENRINIFFKYGIAASVIALLGLGYFMANKVTENTNTQITFENNIQIGTDKATLTLENGTVVNLEKDQEYISDNITSNGKELIYKAEADTKPEIAYNYLTIPRGGQYFVKLSDGTQVWLNSETQLKYPVNFNKGETRQVELVYGEAYFDVSPSIKHNGDKFKVIHNKQEVEVLGTEFNIKAYNDETAVYTTLVEGIVDVNNGINSKILEPNQQTIISGASNTISVHVVDAKGETSWRHGVFKFKDTSFKEILKVLSRWYDMDVVVVDKEIESELFTGTFGKEQNIEDILYLINKLTNIQYDINNKTIFFRK